jgi:hypothetical protein
MNTETTETCERDLYRSEAFAEDVADLVSQAPVIEPMSPPARWAVNAVPFGVALIGAAAWLLPAAG